MTIKGHVEKGIVVLDEPVQLSDGTKVVVQVETPVSIDEIHPEVLRFAGIWPPHASIDEAYDPVY